jgi:RNA recognition motif-containing protein
VTDFSKRGDMANRLFVGNLPYNVTEAELREYFSTIGPLSYISIPTDRETGRQRGFAFLEFKDRAQTDEAIRRFNNQSFKGRSLSVNEARARDDRPQASAPPRPSVSRPRSTAEPDTANQPDNDANRNFGPDASPYRSRRKEKGGLKSERVSKGPMREVVRGQVFFDDDDDDDDDYDDAETSEENSAGHERDADEDNT